MLECRIWSGALKGLSFLSTSSTLLAVKSVNPVDVAAGGSHSTNLGMGSGGSMWVGKNTLASCSTVSLLVEVLVPLGRLR